MKNTLYIIDGNSLLFRAYYATAHVENAPLMRTKDGQPTNAVFAFANMLSRILSSFKGGESLFVAFDADSDTFRKKEYAGYKANRAPCPKELISQFPLARDLLTSLDIKWHEQSGVEADDLAGSVAKKVAAQGLSVVIYTSDRDYLQLIDEGITVEILKTGLSNMEEMTISSLKEKMNLRPEQIVDYKALRGDDSDNLPGVKGIGPKTATKLLEIYGNWPSIVEHKEEIEGKVGNAIREHLNDGQLSYELARIKTDVELPFTIEDLFYPGYSFEKISAFANKYELYQLLHRLPLRLKRNVEEKTEEFNFQETKTLNGFEIGKEIGFAFDLDFTAYHEVLPKGIAFALEAGTYYLKYEDFLNDESAKEVLENPEIAKNVYDAKASYYALKREGITLKGIKHDLLLASYLLDSSNKSEPERVYQTFAQDINEEQDPISLLDGCPRKTARMAYFARIDGELINKKLNEINAYQLYREIEMPLATTLAKMELEGFPLNENELKNIGKIFEIKKNEYATKIEKEVGHSFNLNSPKQVADVLFNELKLPDLRGGSTSVEVLTKLAEEYPICSHLLEYRKYQKLLSTYVDGLLPYLKEDKKLHSYFNQAQTSTGRLSSSSPNLQNISTRDEESRLLRKAFHYADPNILIMSLDYSQIELRMLAALSHSDKYIRVFKEGHDAHSETASAIFHTEKVTPEERRKAKAVNFAIIYGVTDYGLAEQIGTSSKEASEIIDRFYKTYPEIKLFLDNILHEAETKGYVTTIFGRRRYMREIHDPNYARREAAKRAALNAPIQGSAADLIKLAMVQIDRFLEKRKAKTKMVLQIHDELIFMVPEEEIDEMKEKLGDLMVKVFKLEVPLEVECGVGHTWYDAKE